MARVWGFPSLLSSVRLAFSGSTVAASRSPPVNIASCNTQRGVGAVHAVSTRPFHSGTAHSTRRSIWRVTLRHPRMLKFCSSSISEPLAALFNSSLTSGKVPSEWKISRITPIHKKGDASNIANYRPISLLSLVGKLLERLVHSALMGYLLDHDIFSASQFGFRPGGSTQEALLFASQFWHSTMELGGSNAVVFLDISKAFDTLHHQRIVDCLNSAGVQGSLLQWFGDYLSGRSQSVAIHGVSSVPSTVPSCQPTPSSHTPGPAQTTGTHPRSTGHSSCYFLQTQTKEVTLCLTLFTPSVLPSVLS